MKLRLAALSGALLLAANPPSFAHIGGPPGWSDPPGGSSGQIQWNDSGAFAGITGSNVTSNGAVTLDPTSGVALTVEPASGSDALDVEGNVTVGVQNTTQGTQTLAGPASGSYGGALTLNNSGSSGAPSVTLFNGTWFQGGGAVPTFQVNTSGYHTALDLSANGTSNSTWIDACSTDLPADAAAHSGTIENYTCAHFESDPSGSVYIYSNIYSSSVFQTPGTMYLNQNPNGGSPDYGPVSIPGALTVGNGLTVSSGGAAITGAATLASGSAGNAVNISGGGLSITGTLNSNTPSSAGLDESSGTVRLFSWGATTSTAGIIQFWSKSSNSSINNVAAQIEANADFRIGGGTAISTSATGGFFSLETMNGVPTGTPANHATGVAQCVVDYSDGKLECYYNGGWNHLAFAAGT